MKDGRDDMSIYGSGCDGDEGKKVGLLRYLLSSLSLGNCRDH
jgi:hypothetical protein